MPKPGARWTDLDHAKQDDDMLSYLFVDLGLFRKLHDNEHRITRKFNRDEFRTQNGVKWANYLEILTMVKKGRLTPKEGSLKLLKMGTFKTMLMKKRTTATYQHLLSHFDRYMELWRPDSPFKLFITKRYLDDPKASKGKGKEVDPTPDSVTALPEGTPTPEMSQADVGIAEDMPLATPPLTIGEPSTSMSTPGPVPSTSATPAQAPASPSQAVVFGPPLDVGVKSLKAYKVNEHLRLFGSAADITHEHHEELHEDTAQLKADFSVLYSKQKHCYQLFMGPGRYVNHDCDPNIELIKSGRNLCFKAIKPIKEGDELLTFYGAEYFGPSNENCRCATCKVKRIGYWSFLAKKKKGPVVPEDPFARKTRSGAVPAPQPSLRKDVHKANLARTNLVITQGSRRSERSSTQTWSQTSIELAKKDARSGKKRKHNDSSDEDDEPVRKTRAKKQKGGKKKTNANGSDSSLTDMEEWATVTSLDTSAIEGNASSIIEQPTEETDSTAAAPTEDTSIVEPPPLAVMSEQAPVDPASTCMTALEEDFPSPLAGSTPAGLDMLSPAPSDPAVESATTLPSSSLRDKLQEGWAAAITRAAFVTGFKTASEVSDIDSPAQSSAFDQEDEKKE